MAKEAPKFRKTAATLGAVLTLAACAPSTEGKAPSTPETTTAPVSGDPCQGKELVYQSPTLKIAKYGEDDLIACDRTRRGLDPQRETVVDFLNARKCDTADTFPLGNTATGAPVTVAIFTCMRGVKQPKPSEPPVSPTTDPRLWL